MSRPDPNGPEARSSSTHSCRVPATELSSRNGVPFHPYLQKNRAGLLLLNGVVYTAWTSYCDAGPYHGWIIGYDAKTLRQVSVFNSSPNAWQGSFWMGGAAPAADSDGNIFVSLRQRQSSMPI